ncbi:MBL fold metallo-hydrolase RNA specificity domain-containing protein [Mucilaginibacter phyllosphaerae]|uniref:MBL fold metallo-hydrolase n=1 Tax=Mucilaginibacter phyllosphaerae TaxID=1812349 RepID=A0A4Y8AA08_9SPHI|nr:MBL fold metallo-hydrolase [Mucilaginibacter phyllosphaerae]MBB3969894.1 metallo-beta-lactamase family protein [Mucilaginibacter phyllosphaerae]TEW65268.1 MBL fold metallo-hydrolase [Mucilaginibacter phyllosphaerae]GGH16943.1 MBL fold hydrolase [Mucilaginibacter phyllosphaerae]
MDITFHGAARNVTGSKHLLRLQDGTSVLLDCGMFQGLGEQTDDMNEHFGFNPKKVDYLILSHAHIDHCGLIPRLVKEGFEGQIFCTAPTMDLARILLMDSARIQMQDIEYSNKQRKKKNQPPLEALYTEEDAIAAMRLFKIVDYHEEYAITPRIKFQFTDAGHVLGSAAVHITVLEDGRETHITFSGDVGRYSDLLLKSPQTFPQADYILLESTYGDSLHKDIGPIEDALLEIIKHTCEVKKGKVIIPAFSVGRTQELLYALNALELKGELPDVPYYVDSPLSEKATQVLKDHPEVYNKDVKEVMKVDADPFGFKGLKFIQSTEESIALNDDVRPCVIISSSGMAEAGRVKHHIKNNINNQKNTILMVGYAEPNSLGGRLARGEKEVYIFGEQYQVNAEVQSIKSMSAHGDYEDLLHFLACQDPKLVKKVLLVHGEYEVQQHFAGKLKEKGFADIQIPYQHEKVELG